MKQDDLMLLKPRQSDHLERPELKGGFGAQDDHPQTLRQ